ncbi:D-alanyl-glycyl endopeptidase-like protein [Angomonas deanei]|uniref:CHAP domain containing protein, putative n=1 Tax=Angomonas deanei TaxID=59799 RepID=A0A7G2CPJ8_9TRYP|nr:D-alanyl-glycyl endopeptidase-like protein [Angomonas deanei]CAD2221425.1 CHAP domain containing protein, putative [Angomonas deanei]|eukprot:EPY38650.1 D-alanyl-glycyl endopeptidase-like protein [Angomonas deanei]
MKWQCVEYARRYWMLAGKPEPAFFGDIDSASDIWDLKYAYAVADTSKTFPLLRFSQTRGEGYSSFPRVRDIIIYQKEMPDFPAGHVAVIVGVTFNSTHRLVYVAEQNWDSKQWVSPYYNYTRTIPFMHGDDGKGYYTLNDTSGHILGWMRYE